MRRAKQAFSQRKRDAAKNRAERKKQQKDARLERRAARLIRHADASSSVLGS